MTDLARQAIAETSHINIDELVKAKTDDGIGRGERQFRKQAIHGNSPVQLI